jgi:hypothetical protein
VILNLKEPTIVEGMTTSCKGERSQEGAKPRKRGIDPSWRSSKDFHYISSSM